MKIINVFKTHFDIGFTELAKDVIARYGGKMLEDVLATCESTSNRGEGKRFVWTMAAWPMLQSLKLCSKENLLRAERLIENGQLVVHALPFTTHTEFLSQADLPHLFDSAKAFCQKYKKPFPLSAKMTDVPGHTIALVKALCDNGVKFLHLGCNPASTYPNVPTMFWWQDKFGNRVLTFYNNTYGSGITPPKGWKYPVWLSMQQSNDNIGPQNTEVLDEIEAKTRAILPDAEVLFGCMDDFYNEIIKCDLSDLPVVTTDLGDTWIHGVGTYPKEVSALRRARNIVCNHDLSDEQKSEFYENSILFSEHTWGMDIKTHLTWQRSYEKAAFLAERNLPRYKLVEESWNEQRRRANACARIAENFEPLYPAFPKTETEDADWKIFMDKGQPTILHKPSETSLKPQYRYEIIGTQALTDFMRFYLTRFYAWAISDFGRESYGEVESRNFNAKLISSNVAEGKLVCTYSMPEESRKLFGNAETAVFTIGITGGKVMLRVELKNKCATPYIEGGNLFIKTDCEGKNYHVKKIDYDLDVSKDIAENANNVMYCVSDEARIDNICVNPIDSPLVSFSSSAIFKFNGGNFKKPKRPYFVFNLFNNMWGTNFPQWTEGSFVYDYIISAR